MNIYLMIAIILTNIIAISVVYQFIKKLEQKEKVIFIGISVAIIYIVVSIVYWLSGINIDKNVHEASKNFIIYMFVPVNVILFIPYIAYNYMKLREKKLKREKFSKNFTLIAIIAICVLVCEFLYFQRMQKNIVLTTNNINNSNSNTEIVNDEQNILNEDVNKIVNQTSNELTNELTNTTVTNTVKGNNTVN